MTFRRPTVVTHNGSFHADDVFAVAVLSLVKNGKLKVVRTRDMKIISKANFAVDVGTVYDAGKKRFDHHQIGGAGKRENSIPFASVGLVWKHYGEELCESKKVADILDRKIIQYIDALDNGVDVSNIIFEGVGIYGISDAVRSYLPTWKEFSEENMNERFLLAVEMAKKVLQNEIYLAKAGVEAENLIKRDYENSSDKRLAVLSGKGYPWHVFFENMKEALFVVEEHSSGENWRVSGVRTDASSFVLRKALPESWAGKRDAELASITGISDAVFCHNGRFMAVAKSKEGALALAKLALDAK